MTGVSFMILFWKSYIGRPMLLVGPSLGAAVAIDFAINHPEAVSIDSYFDYFILVIYFYFIFKSGHLFVLKDLFFCVLTG